MRFFRVQGKGYNLSEMRNHQSIDGAGDSIENGLAVSGSPDGLDGGSRFGGAWDAMDGDDDVVVLEGDIIHSLYDGYIINPTREVARFKVAQWEEMLETGEAWEYED